MMRRFKIFSVIFALAVLVIRCGQSKPPRKVYDSRPAPNSVEDAPKRGYPGPQRSDATASTPPVEPRELAEDGGRLGFRITNVYRDQKLLAKAPWHAAGGAWTFLDGALKGDEKASFTLGYTVPDGAGGGDVGYYAIYPLERTAAAAFVDRLAKAFGAGAPAKAGRSFEPDTTYPWSLMVRERSANTLSAKWSLTATRDFNQAVIEMVVSVDLAALRGELVCRDEEDNERLFATLAHLMRDGAVPPLEKRWAQNPALRLQSPAHPAR